MKTLKEYLQENYKTKNIKTLIKRFTNYQNWLYQLFTETKSKSENLKK